MLTVSISKNEDFSSRKGVGDIDALHEKWDFLQNIINAKERPQMTEAELKKHWDEVSSFLEVIVWFPVVRDGFDDSKYFTCGRTSWK